MSILDFWKKQTASTHEVPFFFFFGLWGVGWGGVVWGVEYWRICKFFLESLDKNLFVLACTWAVIYRWQQAVPLKRGLLRRILAFTNFVYSVVVLNYSCIGFLVSTSFAVLHWVLLDAIVFNFHTKLWLPLYKFVIILVVITVFSKPFVKYWWKRMIKINHFPYK